MRLGKVGYITYKIYDPEEGNFVKDPEEGEDEFGTIELAKEGAKNYCLSVSKDNDYDKIDVRICCIEVLELVSHQAEKEAEEEDSQDDDTDTSLGVPE